MPQHLPRFHRKRQQAEDLAKLAKILLETDAEPAPEANGKVIRASADGHHDIRRRGLPLVAKGVPGAIPGSDPLGAAIRAESRRRHHS